MISEDSIHLLKECDAGTKMGVTSIDDVLEYTNNTELKELLSKSKAHHTKLGNEIHELLLEYGSEEKASEYYAVVGKQGWTAISMADDWATIYGEGVEKIGLPGVEDLVVLEPAA